MPLTQFKNRSAFLIENEQLRVSILQQGGHLAEIYDKQAGVSPLWIPPWPSMEPAGYDRRKHPEYGNDAESKPLAGIMGHNLCLDIFGPPSPEEEAAGLTVHGEASVEPYEFTEGNNSLVARVQLPLAQIQFERTLTLRGRSLHIRETVQSAAAYDRPIAWTQHVTLGPPFLEKGSTQLRASLTRSKVFASSLGPDMHLKQAAEFDWPMAPFANGGEFDLRTISDAPASSEYTAHLTDPQKPQAFFMVYSPAYHLAFAYVWKRTDFPWLGIWREDSSRKDAPWNGHTKTLGLEFGVSPMPETRRSMIDRGALFDTPGYRWLPAKGKLEAEYTVLLRTADAIPETIGE